MYANETKKFNILGGIASYIQPVNRFEDDKYENFVTYKFHIDHGRNPLPAHSRIKISFLEKLQCKFAKIEEAIGVSESVKLECDRRDP